MHQKKDLLLNLIITSTFTIMATLKGRVTSSIGDLEVQGRSEQRDNDEVERRGALKREMKLRRGSVRLMHIHPPFFG